MVIKGFEEIIAWQKAKLLYERSYKLLKTSKEYSFKDQFLRAALSVSNNIAEGFDRGSDKELKQFLIIARGSNAEVRSMLLIAKDLNIIDEKNREQLADITIDISKLLTGFIKSLTNDK